MDARTMDREALIAGIRALAPELVAVIHDLDAVPIEQLRLIYADIKEQADAYEATGLRPMDGDEPDTPETHPA